MGDRSPKLARSGGIIAPAFLLQADRAVIDLQGMLDKRLESRRQKPPQSTSPQFKHIPVHQSHSESIVPKLFLLPKKPGVTAPQSDLPVASSRRLHQTARGSDSDGTYTILKSQHDEIKLLRLTVEQLGKERDSLLAQNAELLKALSGIDAFGQHEDLESPRIRVVPESRSQSLGLYSCEMIDPMKRVPRSFRLRVLAHHRRHSPTKAIISKPDRATCANVADYSSEPAQRVAYTSGRKMAQYMLDTDANDDSRFSSLTAYCRTRLAQSRQTEHHGPTGDTGTGRQALKAAVNPFVLATACHCMERLIEASPMYQDVMKEVFAEIMVGLYAPDTIHYNNASDTPQHQMAAPADALLRHLQNIPYCELNRLIGADLLLAQTELKDSWTLAKRVLLVEDSLSAIIRKQLQTFQSVLLRFCFSAWLEALNCRRIWKENFLAKAIKKHRMVHLLKVFCAWRSCMDLAELERSLVQLNATMADEKRLHGGEVWNLQDQLKHSDDENSALRLKMSNYTTLHDNANNWRKRCAEVTGHIVGVSNVLSFSEIRCPIPITNIFAFFPEEQRLLNPQTPSQTSTVVGDQEMAAQKLGVVRFGQLETNQPVDTSKFQTTSGTSRPGTSSSRPGTHGSSRPGSSNRPGSAGQLPSLEITVAKLIALPVEEIIARIVVAGTGVAITGWSEKQVLSGLLHSKMLDFMQMQDYETVHKDPDAAADIWLSVLSRAKQMGAAFHESVTTPESLMAKSPATRCVLMADIILNCGCPSISSSWPAFRQRFVTPQGDNSAIVTVHKKLLHLVSSHDSTHDLSNREDVALSQTLEDFGKGSLATCEHALGAYRDLMEFSSCMRVVQELVRRWFNSTTLKLGEFVWDFFRGASNVRAVNRQDVKLADVNLGTSVRLRLFAHD